MASKTTSTFSTLLDAGLADKAEIDDTECRIFREIVGKHASEWRLQ